MTDELTRARNLSPEQKRALLQALLKQEPVGARTAPVSFAQQRLLFLGTAELLSHAEQQRSREAENCSCFSVALCCVIQNPLECLPLRREPDDVMSS